MTATRSWLFTSPGLSTAASSGDSTPRKAASAADHNADSCRNCRRLIEPMSKTPLCCGEAGPGRALANYCNKPRKSCQRAKKKPLAASRTRKAGSGSFSVCGLEQLLNNLLVLIDDPHRPAVAGV